MRIIELFEKRKSEKVPALQELLKYEGQGNIFVSFTAINKIGINPDQTVAAGTPYGIYAYNLDMVIDDMKNAGKASEVAAKGEQPFIWVLEQTSGNFISSPEAYTEDMFQQDLRNMKGFYSKYADERDYSYMGAELSQSNNAPFAKLIDMTREAAKDGSKSSGKNMPLLWNVAFRHLGYTGITDNGTGAIHPNEPIQTIFFEKSAFKVVNRVYNTEYDGKTKRVGDEVSPDKETKAKKQADQERFHQQKMDRFAKRKNEKDAAADEYDYGDDW